EDVFEGYINIVQDDWSLHSLDLTTYKLGFAINIKRSYAEVEEHTWMPITTNLDAEGTIFGIAFEYHYLSTIGKYDLQLNPELGGYVEVIDEKTQPEVAKRVKKGSTPSEIESKLADGGEITRKDLRKLMREYQKEERKESEAPEVISNYSFNTDSSKTVTDTAVWADIRPVPLTALEVRGYEMLDSIQKLDTVPEQIVSIGMTNGNSDDARLKVKRDAKKKRTWRRSYIPEPFFSPVEGYAPGLRIGLKHKKKPIDFGLRSRYGIGWKRLTAEGDLSFGKSGIRAIDGVQSARMIRLTGGRYLRQFDPNNALGEWWNTSNTLMGGTNYINHYERAYAQLDYNKQHSDRLRSGLRLVYEDRRAVVNSSNNNWWGLGDNEAYEANAPVNAALGRITEVSDAATLRYNIEWRPGLRFEIRNGKRQVLELSAPKVGLEIEQGFSGIGNSVSDFTRVQASYEHRFDVGRRGQVDFLVKAGSFLNNGFVDFPDFRHFATTEFTFTNPDPIANYRLLDYYQESTNEEYVEVYAHYQFRKLLLTQIYALHLKGLKEDVFVNYLYTPTSENYTEVGYSLDNILRFLRVEFVTSFRDFQYEDFGVRVSVSTNFGRLLSF
ncbi:MAG: hypothetical protein ACJAZ9_001130, partial [Neolewinella sp.]